ncbi:site-specific integrase [Shewanella oncorhynchi]|uniref:site-specific integrase n=1 Tax=Shewanella oncorhynchi TaxID=2726434 RepID=UPI003D79D207
MDLAKNLRIIILHHVENSYAEISSKPINDNSTKIQCSNTHDYYVTPHPAYNEKLDIYLFPFLLNKDGSPWAEANLFLFSSARDNQKGYSNSDFVRQKAGMLLDYKIFCEDNNIDLMLFNGRRPQRPTYRYFFELLHRLQNGNIQRHSLNKKTKVVYDFYKFLSKLPNSQIEIERVDSVETIKLILSNHYGRNYSINQEKRGQTVAVCRAATPVPIGFVREYGEDLRPLREPELKELLRVLELECFAVDERLIHYIAMHTGARKQSILTLRMKHLNTFTRENLLKDGTYKINAGPGTGIDTKFNKNQSLYFPRILAEQILIYARSKKAKNRRNKFLAKNGTILSDDDIYVFLSPEGEPHYMAKNDPRYKITKSKPQGRNTYYIKNKLLKYANANFPSAFSFHWLRATFAYRYYRWLQPLCAKGHITDGDIISLVQKRLHHSDRATTEHYLKLFDSIDERLVAQTIFEERVFDLYGAGMEGVK